MGSRSLLAAALLSSCAEAPLEQPPSPRVDPGLICPPCHRVEGRACAVIEACTPPCTERLRAEGTTPSFGRGQAVDVAIDGPTAVLLTSIALETYDVRDRDRPVPLGWVALSGSPSEVALDGTMAWVAAGSAGVFAVDVSDPVRPIIVRRIERYRSASGVEPYAGGLLIADQMVGLAILDREDLTVAEVPIPSAIRVRAVDGRAYVAAGAEGIVLVDIEQATVLGRLETPGLAESIAVSGATLFVSAGQGGVRIVDASDPRAPVELAAYGGQGGWTARELVLDGDRAYVASGVIQSFRVLDVSDRSAPSLISSIDTHDAVAVALDEGDVFLAGGIGGLIIVDPDGPRVRSSFDDAGYARSLRVAGDRAYVADTDGGLRIVDISDPERPIVISSIQTKQPPHALEIDGSTLYVVSRYQDVAFQTDGYLEIFDVSDARAPIPIAELDFYGWVDEIAFARGILYVAMVYGPFAAIDVRDPSSPAMIGSTGHGRGYGNVALSEGVAFVSYRYHGFVAIDLSDPTALVEIGSAESGGEAFGLALDGDVVYLADGRQGLGIFDVRAANAPVEIGRALFPGFAAAVRAKDGRALVADRDGFLRLFDVRDPSKPRLVDGADFSGQATGIAMKGERAFVASGDELIKAIAIECGGSR